MKHQLILLSLKNNIFVVNTGGCDGEIAEG